MTPAVDRLPERLHAALAGAAVAEDHLGPAGVRQLLDLCTALAATAGTVDPGLLRAAGFDVLPAGGSAALLLRAVPAGLLTPLDRPRFRLAAHRLAMAGGADEGTAMTAVAVAILAADLTRFDIDTALVRLRQTLLEEAPSALHLRLRPMSWADPVIASPDPGAALQLAITALSRADTLPSVIEEALSYAGDSPVGATLAGALAGARSGFDGCDPSWMSAIPAAAQVAAAAEALAPHAQGAPPARLQHGAAAILARLGAGIGGEAPSTPNNTSG